MTPSTCSGLVAQLFALAVAPASATRPSIIPVAAMVVSALVPWHLHCKRPIQPSNTVRSWWKWLAAFQVRCMRRLRHNDITCRNNVPTLQVRYELETWMVTSASIECFSLEGHSGEIGLYPKRAVLVQAATSANLASRLLPIVQLGLLALYLHPGGKTRMAGLLPSMKPDGSSTTRVNL